MTEWSRAPAAPGAAEADARGAALAGYFRSRAALSPSGDGTALLDAAGIAETMTARDGRLRALSDAGHFGSTPGGRVLFLDTPEVRAVLRRQLATGHQSGAVLLARLVAAVAVAAEARSSLDELSWRVREARAQVHAQRQGRAGTRSLTEARQLLLVALEAYVDELERRRFPVPAPLHAELELHRKLFF